VVVRTVAESSTRRELVENGQVDLTFNLTPQDYVALRTNPKVHLVAPYATEVDYAIMTEWGPLASPYARQALAYAFPYTAYINGVFKGYAKRAYGPIPSALLGYDPHGFHYQTDLTKARALLAQAGVKPGTTLTYDYGTNGGPAALLLQAQLAQIGLKLKVQQLSDQAMSSILFGTEPPSKRPNLMFQTWWPDYNDPWDMCDPLVASSAAGAAGANSGYYHDKAVDALLDQMKNAGQQTLVADAHKLQDITGRQDPAAIWAAEPAQVTVMAANLKGFVPNPIELHTYGFYALHH
jgi:ABC-type transport system substrate-binding protein